MATVYKVFKYHGLGNDYLVYDPNQKEHELAAREIQMICDRHFGVGSDGILMGPYFKSLPGGVQRIVVKIMNPDGSEAEKSGNGVRIFAKYLRDAGYIQKKNCVIETMGGDVEVHFLNEEGSMLRVSMGKTTFDSDKIPMAGAIREVVNEPMRFAGKQWNITCVSIGNPHCIIPVPRVSRELVEVLGPIVESAASFPNRVNVQIMEVVDRNRIRIEIYERGAGYTLASGTSSCAAAVAAYRLGLTDRRMVVEMPGGELEIEIAPDGMVFMTGSVASVGEFVFSEEFFNKLFYSKDKPE